MTFDKSLVDSFIDAIMPLPERFGLSYSSGDEIRPEFFDIIEDAIWEVDAEAYIDYGASKLVIIPSDTDYVIKIPFNGYFYISYNDMNQPTEEWYDFCYAPSKWNNDYCWAEFEKYQDLKNENLNCFVAETCFYTRINSVGFYIQEKVNNNKYDVSIKPSDESILSVKDIKSKGIGQYVDPNWMGNCIDAYGKEKVEEFLIYCENEDEDIIADLHKNNYGYRKDLTPAILDFSNYMD